MKIKIGDRIKANHNREGVIDSIKISTDIGDVAGEYSSSISAKEYDTELNYLGNVGYIGDSNESYWCYFHQIEGVIKC
tara:strand:+ start:377 stop:610 length:234 start_codon:yes stop_codon:yes gene_type:complete